ncbi:MAG: hypothetical protein JWM27_4124 [Gemmatimonadetes bacterium]|nr:hypothetical protein [Gemmatimonadota bacterium]
MIPRRVIALAGLLALPALASAQRTTLPPGQTGPQLPYARWAVTPYIGVRAPLTTGNEFQYQNGEAVSTHAVSRERGGAVLGGLEAEYRFRRHWSFVGGVAASARGNDVLTFSTPSSADTLGADGDRFFFAKAGVSYRLPEPSPDTRRFHPGGFVTLAPALVRLDRAGLGKVNNPAVNLGLAATAPLGSSRRLAFQLAVDDYLTFWDKGKLEAQDAAFYSTAAVPVTVHYSYSTSNILVLRLGASFRMP